MTIDKCAMNLPIAGMANALGLSLEVKTAANVDSITTPPIRSLGDPNPSQVTESGIVANITSPINQIDLLRQRNPNQVSRAIAADLTTPAGIAALSHSSFRRSSMSKIFGGGKSVQDKVADDLREEVQMIRMRTLFEMVNELEVESERGKQSRNVVWLTNKQAQFFEPATMKRLLDALEITNPPPLVIFVRGGMFSNAMVSNGGVPFLTRTKYGVPLTDVVLINDNYDQEITPLPIGVETFSEIKLTEANVAQFLTPGITVLIKLIIAGGTRNKKNGMFKLTEAQVLNMDNGQVSVTVKGVNEKGDPEVATSLDMLNKLVAENKGERATLDRKISIFVSKVLMPIIIKNGALVVTGGVGNCSLCVALGDAFARLSSQRNGLIERGASSKQSLGGVGNPRMVGIVKYPVIAAAALRPGSNAHSLITANNEAPENRKMSFVGKPGYDQFLLNINGRDMEAWSQYDLVDGLTDVIFIDRRNAETGQAENGPFKHFFNAFSALFSNEIPSLSIQLGQPSNSGGGNVLGGLVDLVSRESDLLVLDTRQRGCREGASLSEGLQDLTKIHRRMWLNGAVEEHVASTLSFLHHLLCERPREETTAASKKKEETTSSSSFCMYISSAIQQHEKKLALLQRGGRPSIQHNHDKHSRRGSTTSMDADTDQVDIESGESGESGENNDLLASELESLLKLSFRGTTITNIDDLAKRFMARRKEQKNAFSMDDDHPDPTSEDLTRGLLRLRRKKDSVVACTGMDEKSNQLSWTIAEMTFDEFITAVVDIYRANTYVYTMLNALHFEHGMNDKNSDSLHDETKENLEQYVKRRIKSVVEGVSIKQLAEKSGRSKSGYWLRLHTLLEPAWERGSFAGSDLISGSLSDPHDLLNTLERRMAVIDRLPSGNSLEELYALRDAWNDVDRYELISAKAKMAAKWSFILMLVLGVATVAVASLVGAGMFRSMQETANEIVGNVTSSVVAEGGTGKDAADAVQGLPSSSSIFLTSPGDAAAFGLAVFSSLVATYIGYTSPVQRWQQLRSSALTLRSEITRFRTRTGDYDYTMVTQDALVLREAVTSLRGSTLSRAGISSSTFFKKYPIETFVHGQYLRFDPPPTTDLRYKRPPPKPDTRKSRKIFRTVVTPTFTKSPEWHVKPIVDNYHSPMDANSYIALRLEPMLRFYQQRIKPYSRSKNTAAIFLMLATSASAIMASLGMTVWIGIVSILASSVTSWKEFSGVGKKLERYGGAITKLRDVRLWWETLTVVEQSSSKNVTRLLDMTEDVINHDTQAWLATSMAAKSLSKAAAAAKGEH